MIKSTFKKKTLHRDIYIMYRITYRRNIFIRRLV